MQVRVDINGERHERDVPGELTLASLLRDDLGLTGTKVACGEGTAAAARCCSTAAPCCRV